MDPISSLSAVVTTVKNLKAISDTVRDAKFKALLADLSIQLSELKMRLSDVMDENTQMKATLRSLESPEHDPCPRCKKKTWKVESSRPDADFGDMGGVVRTYMCSECKFTEDKFSH